MQESRLMSLMEALANVAIGYGVAVLTRMLVFPLFRLQATLHQNLKIGLIFTVVSLLRGYALRQLFELVERKRMANAARQGAQHARTHPAADAFRLSQARHLTG